MTRDKVAVLGAGSWGTAVAAICAGQTSTVLWSRRADLAERISSEHRNPDYLSDYPLPDGLRASADIEASVEGAGVVIMAVPSHGFRDIMKAAAPALGSGAVVLSLTKGLEQGSLKRMTELVDEVVPGRRRGVLTGPNLAVEVMAGQPTASVVAVDHTGTAEQLQRLLSTATFRVYTNPDLIGCEMAGALKNVMAIAAGIADGIGFGDNSKAALITRGLAELTRLGVAMGGEPLTFSGLAGMGDLIATCISRHSRNRHVGEELGRGRRLSDIVADMNMVAEGVKTAPSVLELAQRYQVETPIAAEVVEVLADRKSARDVIPALMQREAKPELYGIHDRA
ncbi:MAG TPA: NAD(P)H-dependent glycerol-3-phosphate dehydrogenase [Acidimicrobiales bacterium]|nr:NAD(P)H-dependent glycerol-3-phosphate dehydrogenase [Acidimicrobiales bacterium]